MRNQIVESSRNPTTWLLLDSQKPTEFTSLILKPINCYFLRILSVTQTPRNGIAPFWLQYVMSWQSREQMCLYVFQHVDAI